jgi:hypothetical protein
MVMEPESVGLRLLVTEESEPLGFCVFRLESSSCCSRESVGEPKSGSGVPELVLPSCALTALISEL